MACFKRKKERDVAPTRGQFPCPAFGPHGASLSAWVCLDFFLGSFFLLFVFSLSFFSGFLNPNALSLQHCQSGHLRTCAQPEICRQQVPEKVWDDLSLWYEPDLVKMCVYRGHLPFVSDFSNDHWVRKRGTLQKMSDVVVASDPVVLLMWFNTWGNFVIEMRSVQF